MKIIKILLVAVLTIGAFTGANAQLPPPPPHPPLPRINLHFGHPRPRRVVVVHRRHYYHRRHARVVVRTY